MFDKPKTSQPRIGRQHVEIRPNPMGEKWTWIIQIGTRTADGYDWGPPLGGMVFTSKPEAIAYRRKYVFKDHPGKGTFTPDPNAIYPKLAMCGHVGYRNHNDMCIEDSCHFAAYQTFDKFEKE